MKIVFSFFLIFLRIWIGYRILAWIVVKSFHPEMHSISEIEVHLVIAIFDTWLGKSQDNIDISLGKNDEN
jgi:hypothetical protein